MDFSSLGGLGGGGGDSASSSASASNTFGATGLSEGVIAVIGALVVFMFAVILVLKS